MDELLTIAEAARLLKVSARHMYDLCYEGHVAYVLVGGPLPSEIEGAERKADDPLRWNLTEDLAPLGRADSLLTDARAESEGQLVPSRKRPGAIRISRAALENYIRAHTYRVRPEKAATGKPTHYEGLAEINEQVRRVRTEAAGKDGKGRKPKGKRRGR